MSHEALDSLPVEPSTEAIVEVDSAEAYTVTYVDQIKSSLNFHDNRAWFLAEIFNADFYRSSHGIPLTDSDELFAHYLSTGFQQNLSPSPLIDIKHTRQQLADLIPVDLDENESVMHAWLEFGFESIVPNAWFDEAFYLDLYTDLEGHVEHAFWHFATQGIKENRFPCDSMRQFFNILLTEFDTQQVTVQQFVECIPNEHIGDLLNGNDASELRKLFMAPLYRAQLPQDVQQSDTALFVHFVCIGSQTGLRPSVLFNEEYYLRQLENYIDKRNISKKPDTFSGLAESETTDLQVGLTSPYFHWFYIGRKLDIVPTPLFDSEYYQTVHADIRSSWKNFPFEHYLQNGVTEKFRRISLMFDSAVYLRTAGKTEFDSPLLDYILRGQFLSLSPCHGIALGNVVADNLLQCSKLEKAAIMMKNKLSRLDSGVIAEMIERAKTLEPQIMRPYGVKHIRMAPIFQPEVDLMAVMRKVKGALKQSTYDSIVLIPHCRMAGSARVAGTFTHALNSVKSDETALVVLTDFSQFDRPDWFPDNVDVFDLSSFIEGIPQDARMRALLDLVRGLTPKRIFNINSNLGWHLTNNYGRQISVKTDIYIYLFCWDKDIKGNKGGYPIQWFLPTFDFCKGVFTDSTVLRDELVNRYCMSKKQVSKIVTLHTPSETVDVDYHNALSARSETVGTRRVFWSGRFDRQKRVDILFETARKLPDVEFWVWGKEVLGDSNFDLSTSPPNLKMMGTYQHTDDLPIASCDCFLYTAEWDGLPTILIEIGSRGIPVVASGVGGVVDLINEQTGWPIKDFDNPDTYVSAISEIIDNYPKALERASRLRSHTLSLCNDQAYKEQLESILMLGDAHD